MQNRLTKEQRDGLPTQYQAGASCQELAGKYQVSVTAIRGLLVRRGVKLRSNSESHKRCSLNEFAFSRITPESAYWAGFIFADGYILHRGSSAALTIRITEADIAHLKKFRNFLGSSHAITRIAKNTKQWTGSKGAVQFSIRSSKIAGDLENWGWKSKLQHDPVNELCESSDFWRGVIDGDGWIRLVHQKSYYNNHPKIKVWSKPRVVPRLELVGGYPLLEKFAKFVHIHTGKKPKVLPHKSIFRVTLGGGIAKVMVQVLYENACVSLDRKQNAAINILSAGTVDYTDGGIVRL